MGRRETIPIVRKMTVEELESRIKTLEKSTRVLKRLYFIRHRYEGNSVEEASEKVGVYKMMGYQWQNRWNEDGYEGLIPRFAGGKPTRLSHESIDQLKGILKERDDWTTEDVQDLIEKKYHIRFSLKHIRTILRKMGMHYSKPYQHDYRRPNNAEEILKKT